jgi:hypothetical protein
VDTVPNGPAVDFCVRITGTDGGVWAGPILKNLNEPNGITYAQASYYVALPAACYDVRVVNPNADCSTNFFGTSDFINAGCAAPGLYSSLVVKGAIFSSYPLGLVTIQDDLGPTTGGDAALRFFNAFNLSNATTADFGTILPDGGLDPLLDAVPYGTAAPQTATVDANNYLQIAPFTDTIGVRAANGGPLLLTAGPISTVADAAYSMFGIGLDGQAAAQLLVCRDDGTLGLNAGAGLAPCQTVP